MSGLPPFTVLQVCMGNICRSPMAERLLVVEATRLVGQKAPELLHTHGAGTGAWHAGDRMDPGAARQVRRRGGDPEPFRARHLRAEHIEGSDLVLTATGDQWEFVEQMVPDATGRTFVLGEFGRLLGAVSPVDLPPFAPEPDAVYARGVALVAAVDRVRAGAPPRACDDLDDPWGCGEQVFAKVADEIESTVRRLARLVLS